MAMGLLVGVMTVSLGLAIATTWLSADPCLNDWDVACSSTSASILDDVQWWGGTVPFALAARIALPLLLAGLPLGLYWLAVLVRSRLAVVID